MKRTIALVAATAMSLAPAAVLAKPTTTPPTTNSISPAHDTGQPGLECTDEGAVAPGTQSGRDPGPGSPFQADSVSGSHYAGEQVGVNDKNTASVSQYDVACFRPQH
jgi:hypothetical protein